MLLEGPTFSSSGLNLETGWPRGLLGMNLCHEFGKVKELSLSKRLKSFYYGKVEAFMMERLNLERLKSFYCP